MCSLESNWIRNFSRRWQLIKDSIPTCEGKRPNQILIKLGLTALMCGVTR
jgi:hypothetical protein